MGVKATAERVGCAGASAGAKAAELETTISTVAVINPIAVFIMLFFFIIYSFLCRSTFPVGNELLFSLFNLFFEFSLLLFLCELII